jgi:trans-aconitate methyltransferase
MAERKTHWENVYREKQPDEVSWFQEHPEKSLEMIRVTEVGLNEPIIDVGGGASTLVDQLLHAGYSDVSVMDISGAALAHSRSRLGAEAGQVAWIEGDVTEFVPSRQYALWHDRAVFHFLTRESDRRNYLHVLQEALPPGGQVIIATFAPDGPEKCSGLAVERYGADKLQAALGAGFELLNTVKEAHRTPAGQLQHFAYFHLRFCAP